METRDRARTKAQKKKRKNKQNRVRAVKGRKQTVAHKGWEDSML